MVGQVWVYVDSLVEEFCGRDKLVLVWRFLPLTVR